MNTREEVLSMVQELNQETIQAMLEADEIAHDPSVKGYTSIEALRETLKAE